MINISKFLRPLGLTAAIVAGSVLVQSAPAQAVELVKNGNFSAGATDWQPGGAANILSAGTLAGGNLILAATLNATFGNVAVVGAVPSSGQPASIFSGTWSQNLVTNPGSTYTLSFNFANYSDLTSTNSATNQLFEVRRNNVALPGLSLSGTRLTTNLFPTTTTFTGTGNDFLSFVFTGVTASAIDNVSVTGDAPAPTAVPEPLTIVGTIVGGAAVLRMRKKLSPNKTTDLN